MTLNKSWEGDMATDGLPSDDGGLPGGQSSSAPVCTGHTRFLDKIQGAGFDL